MENRPLPTTNQSGNNPLPVYLLVPAVAIGYFVLARLSLLLSFELSNATPVWPPSGFAFAMILLFGYRVAPGILVGAFAANLVVFEANQTTALTTAFIISIIISAGNTAEALTGSFLLKKFNAGISDNSYFTRVRNVIRFSLSAGIMSLVSCTVGATTVFLAGIVPAVQYPITLLTWWLGDVSGIVLVTSFILIAVREAQIRKYRLPEPGRRMIVVETLALLAAVILVSGLVFDNWFAAPVVFRWAFWIIPIVVWSAIRFKLFATTIAVFICSVIAIWGTVNNHGPFSTASLNESLLIVQSYISIIVITALTLKASILERNEKEQALREAGQQLETRVKERTGELAERNQFIETIFDSVEDLMAVFDTNGNYLSVNKKIETTYKLKREDIIGRNVLDVFPQVKDTEMYENLQRAIRGETVHNLVYRSVISRRYFENFYIPLKNNRQNVYGVLVIAHDNTAVMEASEKIEAINKKLNEAQRLAHIGSWQWDVANNRLSWSDELYRIYGVNPEEFETTYENFLRYIHPGDREFVDKAVQEAFAARKSFDFYHRIIRPDGKECILYGRGEVHTNDNNEAVSMTGTAQDVTELKRAEEEIKQMAAELLRYNKELEQTNKELESFTFVASHDLQEPLRKIRTFLTLIAEKELSSLSDTSQDYLRRTVRSSEQMQQLIIDLLTYSRTTGSLEHYKETDLNEILRQVRHELKETIEEKKVTIDADPLPTLNVIPFQVQQLFINLLSNSIKFSKPEIDPHISIRYKIVDGIQDDNSKEHRGKRYHAFTINDNGIGFETKYNEKIFGLFQRLNSKHVYGGTGIGLSICKKIVENHRGFITARGERDIGTTIQFYIPA